jgi:TonB C terminal
MGAMETCGRLQIETWDAATPVVPAAGRYRQRYRPPALWGVIGTLLVHLLLLSSALVVTETPARRPIEPSRPGIPGPQMNSDSADLVLLDLVQANPDAAPVERGDLGANSWQPPRMLAAAITMNLPRVDIPVDQPDDAADNQSAAGADGQTKKARLAGIYSGQIRARIERIWRRPRTPVNEESGTADNLSHADDPFHCQVTIVQDSMGRVQETQLVSCNGSIAWQQSLVRAINQASPLPAPPDPTVFARAVTLNFVGFAFTPTMQADEYELRSNPVAQASSSNY